MINILKYNVIIMVLNYSFIFSVFDNWNSIILLQPPYQRPYMGASMYQNPFLEIGHSKIFTFKTRVGTAAYTMDMQTMFERQHILSQNSIKGRTK